MALVEFQWLQEWPSLKEALQETLQCSGQLLKKHFSSKELNRSLRAKDVSRLPLDLVNHLSINPEFLGPRPQLIKLTPDYLVLHKPSGVHSHPHCYSDQDTLLNFLAQTGHWDTLNVNSQNYDRGLLYRLDYETSGVMLVARNEAYFQKMRIDFKEKMKRKFYWAIVKGDFNREGQWSHFFKGSGPKGSKQRVEDFSSADTSEGVLEVKKIAFQNGYSLVLVNLNSGLRHQIRAQLSHLEYPILGDELYGGEKADRLFLHALRYEWDEEIAEDISADLFDRFFDLNSALKMGHDMFGTFKRR